MGGGRHSQLLDAGSDRHLRTPDGSADATGRYTEANRAGDHIWWVSDVRKFQGHYPDWTYRYDLDGLLGEIHAALEDRVGGCPPVALGG